MELVRGGELKKIMKRPITEEHARFYVMQIVLALGFLHSKMVAHRDLKPENVLIDADGYIKVTDFGLAKIIEPEAQTNSYCGTLEYMAPEILQDKGHSFQVDWWALGILTYEMIVGFTPYSTGARNQRA